MKSYTLTYYRLRKREPLIATAPTRGVGWGVGEGLNFCIRGIINNPIAMTCGVCPSVAKMTIFIVIHGPGCVVSGGG